MSTRRRRSAVRVVDGSIIGWLLVTTNYVASNLSRTARRYRAALTQLPPGTPADDHADEVGDRLDRDGRDRLVRDAFASLSRADQDVITLCVLEEFTTGQAAAALGVPAGTVKSRLSRAKTRLAARTTAALGADSPTTPQTTIGGAR